MIRVVHLVGTLKGYGVQRLILGLASAPALARFRHAVVCIFGAEGDLAAAYRDADIEVRSCPLRWPERPPGRPYRLWRWLRDRSVGSFPWRLRSTLRALQPALVHSHVSARIDLQARAVVGSGLPWVWTLHGVYEANGVEIGRWKQAVEGMRHRAACLTAVSRAIVEHWKGLGLDRLLEPRVTPGGIDCSAFLRTSPDAAIWRSEHHIPADAVVFGSAGRLDPVKGHDLFVEAAGRLASRYAAVHFALAGDGPLMKDLRRRIEALNLKERFHLLGYRHAMPEFLAGLDVFVLPSRSEGLGLALIEAMAAGLPCVATRVGGVPEVLDDSAGVLAPPESAEALAQAMEFMLDPERRRAMGASAARLAQRFSIEACAARFAAIYDELLSGRGSSEP